MSEVPERTDLTRTGPNALARGLGLLGDEWTLLILRAAINGASRYSDFRRDLPISYSVLTARLEVLVAEQLLQRRVYQQNPVRADYSLTERGASVWPVLVSIWEWELRWVTEHAGGSLPAMRHRDCGHQFHPVLSCARCSAAVVPTDVDAEWGPSGGWDRSVPDTATRRRSDARGRGAVAFFPETMAVLGNRWSVVVVGAAFRGVRRYSDLQAALGAPPSMLAERLQVLCGYGVLESVEVQPGASRTEYRLTPKGIALFPVVVALLQWAQRWYHSPEGAALTWTHRGCGGAFDGILVCDHCHRQLHGKAIEIVDAPAESSSVAQSLD